MWIGDKVYFLSDRNNGVVSLFSFDTKSKKVEQVVENKGLDIKYASNSGNTIIYEQVGTIFTLEAGAIRLVVSLLTRTTNPLETINGGILILSSNDPITYTFSGGKAEAKTNFPISGKSVGRRVS